MNLLLDTLRTRLSFRWLGHCLGLTAAFFPLWNWFSNTATNGPALGASAQAALLILGPLAAVLVLLELLLALFDLRARKLKALAPTAFPFKKMEEADRDFVQKALAGIPGRAYGRAWLVWTLGAAVLLGPLGMGWGGVMLVFALGAPLSAATQGLGNTATLQGILPYFYFKDGYALGLKQFLPSLQGRAWRLMGAPLSLLFAIGLVTKVFGLLLSLVTLLWVGAWTLGLMAASVAVFARLVERPLEHMAEALDRLRQGELNALLDVSSGDALGAATEAYNKAIRAVDRRFFMLEKFHQAVTPGRSEGVLEDLRLDGERRAVVVLCARWIGAEEALSTQEPKEQLASLSRFYEAVQDGVDRHQGCTYELGGGVVLALWGAPFKGEGALEQALGAAWELGALLPVLGRQQLQRGLPSLTWALGVSSGEAVAGLGGPRGRERYLVTGPPAAMARQLSLKPGGPWLDAATAAALPESFACAGGSPPRLSAGPLPPSPDPVQLGFSPGERL